MAINQTKAGTWQLDYYEPDGKRKRKTFELKRDAESFYRKIKGEIESGLYVSSEKTFTDAADLWLEQKRQQDYSQGSLTHWGSHIKKSKAAFGTLGFPNMTVETIESETNKWLDTLAPKTVNKMLVTMGSVFQMALRYRWISRNPMELVQRKKIKIGGKRKDDLRVRPDEVYDFDEVRRIIQTAEPGFERAFIMTPLTTGMRHGEIQGLPWINLDLKAGEKAVVKQSLSEGEFDKEGSPIFKHPKTEDGYREIPLFEEYVNELRLWKIQCPPSRWDLVFCKPDGKPFSRKHDSKYILEPIMRRAGVKILTMHQLRHTYASQLLISGAPLPEVSYYLGHSSPHVTLRVYAHWIKTVKTGAVERMAGNIFKSTTKEGKAHG